MYGSPLYHFSYDNVKTLGKKYFNELDRWSIGFLIREIMKFVTNILIDLKKIKC